VALQEILAGCLCGSAEAWSQLYDGYHDRLLDSIRGTFRQIGVDENLVEEISARVWYALVKNNYELLRRYDAARGASFATYLSVIAKSLMYQHFRSERRRRHRETLVSKPIDSNRTEDPNAMVDFEEVFLESLSKQELRFFYSHLLADGEKSPDEYSQQHVWQLRHRVLRKLRTFLSDNR
jgi:DNA-directed RNA polymerase specialized sigma24 family protein